MSDDLTRRQLVRRAVLAACAPALARGLGGCARRISPNRDVQGGTVVDGALVIPAGQVPELDRPGGAIVLHTSCAARPVLIANTGTGFVALQAICPHAGCELAWVGEDLQAECPCHGSRFAGDGTVLNPPAQTNLLTYPATRDPATGDVRLRLFAGNGVFPPVQDGKVVFPLASYPALLQTGGAVLGQPEGMQGALLVTRPAANANPVALSAVCTHQQCTVQPAPAGAPGAFTLYCPCHGSAFDLTGNVTHDPATIPLPTFPVEVDASGIVTITVGSICS
jgi:cytochrome b6-f complex iron-sulfur subunit